MKHLIIIDDNVAARLSLKKMLADYCPDVNIIGEAGDIPLAVRLIKKLNPIAVLLSINLKNGSGFDLLHKFSVPKFQVIFTTYCGDFALKAFRYNAIDYLLKPINPDELIQAIDKIRNISNDISEDYFIYSGQESKFRSFEKVALTTTNGIAFVNLDQIVCLKSDSSYTTFYLTNNKKMTVCKTLKDFESILPEQIFFRPHQSFIVNVNYVERLVRNDGYHVLMDGGKEIPVSRRKKDAFIDFLQEQVRC